MEVLIVKEIPLPAFSVNLGLPIIWKPIPRTPYLPSSPPSLSPPTPTQLCHPNPNHPIPPREAIPPSSHLTTALSLRLFLFYKKLSSSSEALNPLHACLNLQIALKTITQWLANHEKSFFKSLSKKGKSEKSFRGMICYVGRRKEK